MSKGWISITKAFTVECGVCNRTLDECRSYAAARDVAAEHRREEHAGEGMTIGGTWGQNARSDNG